jgi:hypothetical protein
MSRVLSYAAPSCPEPSFTGRPVVALLSSPHSRKLNPNGVWHGQDGWAFGQSMSGHLKKDGGVLVRSEESFDGFIVRLFAGPMRRALASSLEKGVRAKGE